MRDGVYDFPGVEPRRGATDLADLVGISRNAVRERILQWKESGFLTSMTVFVHPQLVGARFVGQYLIAREIGALEHATQACCRSDRLFLLYEYGALVGRNLMFSTLHAYSSDAEQRAQAELLSGLNGVALATSSFPVGFPDLRVALSPLDWRIARAARASSGSNASLIASKLKLSPRTVRRRLDRLLDGNALFYMPNLDFRRSRGSVLLVAVFFRADQSSAQHMGALKGIYPDLVPLNPRAGAELLLPPQADGTRLAYVAVLLPVRSAQSAGEVTQAIQGLPGVREVSVTYPLRAYENVRCFDRLLGPHATIA